MSIIVYCKQLLSPYVDTKLLHVTRSGFVEFCDLLDTRTRHNNISFIFSNLKKLPDVNNSMAQALLLYLASVRGTKETKFSERLNDGMQSWFLKSVKEILQLIEKLSRERENRRPLEIGNTSPQCLALMRRAILPGSRRFDFGAQLLARM